MAKTQKKSAALTTESQSSRKTTKTTKVPARTVKPAKSAPPSTAAGITKNQTADVAVVIGCHSKQAILITLMRRAEGATLDDLISATGWQRHSVRGAISGALKKRLGFIIASRVEERGRVYRIAGTRR